MRTFTHLLLGGLMTLAACDYVKHPLGEEDGPSNGGDGTVAKRVLLEEYTGHHCIYCPEAHVIGQQLHGIYGDDLVIVSLHVTDLAEPIPPIGDGIYDPDYRTPAGDAYLAQWPTASIPKGLINRLPYEGTTLLDRIKWAEATAAIIGQPAKVDLWFSQLAYNDATETVDAQLKIAVAQDLGDTTYKMTVYLVEDSIVSYQYSSLANPPDVPDYTHRHMLRDNLNGTWGEDVLTSANAIGDTVTVTLPPYTFNEGAGEDFNGGHCSLVAYIYNGTTLEVEQVVEKKLMP